MANYSRSPVRRSRSPPRRRSRSRSLRRRSRSPRRSRDYRDRRDQHITEINGIAIRPGENFTDFRTRVRSETTKTIWAPSPERPRSASPSERRKSKKRYDSDSPEDSSEDERDRHRSSRKHKSSRHKSSRHKSSRHKSSRHKSSSSRHRSSRKRKYSDEESDSSDSEDDRKKISTVSKKQDEPALEVDQSHLDQVQDLWVEKKVDLPEDLAPVGPLPLVENDTHDDRAYGGQLLPGEGSAMAAYVQQGKRIPRRGEIGLSGDQISEFEKAGFVMSGSRHQRMNAVRLRKENQVISAEEKRAVLQHAQEQKIKRENEIISGFREILSDKFKKE